MKKFYNVVNSIIYRTREARALIVLNIDRECNFSCKMVKNCSYRYELNREKITNSLPGCAINKQRLIVLFISDVMYKKYKRLVYTPPYLSAKFCKVNLWNTKNLARLFFLASLLDRAGCNR